MDFMHYTAATISLNESPFEQNKLNAIPGLISPVYLRTCLEVSDTLTLTSARIHDQGTKN